MSRTQSKASKASTKKGKPEVNFGANSNSRKRKASPIINSNAELSSSPKRARNDNGSGSTSGGASASTPTGASADTSTDGAADNNTSTKATRPKAQTRKHFGLRPSEVPSHAKITQTVFQRFICGISGILRQSDMLPLATKGIKHYEKHFDNVDDMREHMRNLVNESRTAVSAAKELATKLSRDAKRITGPIANDIAHIPEVHLATVFTMFLKAGLKGFCPDVEGPVQSTYNQLHRHLAVCDASIAANTELLEEFYDGYTYGRLTTKTRMDGQSLQNSTEFKARTRRMANIVEAHSDDEHSPEGSLVREKPGRNPIVGQFFREQLNVSAEEYRMRNAKPGQRAPKPRTRQDPLLPPSYFGKILPPDVPVGFFTPEYYNQLTLKERARYVNTGVAFPLPALVFNPAHAGWKYLGKKEFMENYGYDVLEQYDIPSAEEIDVLPPSDAEDDEEVEEINLEDTDDEDEPEMELITKTVGSWPGLCSKQVQSSVWEALIQPVKPIETAASAFLNPFAVPLASATLPTYAQVRTKSGVGNLSASQPLVARLSR
ncbi:hypothetical protein GGX14DRAFT_645365 [Mycena pura]|uniref:Uncharacterized protein n=1 Tax=Mycena pura TaxID=153505 RepID=A0AAD6Y888_9AGAR|nr:hypothetical protein GGX14DRAFT_645365 [Mycena pura]